MKKIKFIIDSDLNNVSLVGMSVRKLCELTPLSENQSFQVELCAVEAINNSITHAYGGTLLNEVSIILSIKKDYILLEVNDIGKPMDSEVLENAKLANLDENSGASGTVSESGRGLAIIKEFMDKVSYCSNDQKNSLIMIKYY